MNSIQKKRLNDHLIDCLGNSTWDLRSKAELAQIYSKLRIKDGLPGSKIGLKLKNIIIETQDGNNFLIELHDEPTNGGIKE